MSEKRYLVKGYGFAPNGENIFGIFDSRTKSPYYLYAFNDDGLNKIVRIMNEQQEKIEHLEECNHGIGQDIIQSFDKRLELMKENEQLRQELQGMEKLLQSYRKTIRHNAELLADASKNGYLPPLDGYVSKDGWICGCCKHFHSGVRDRCDKGNNWVLKDGSCQDFER